MLGLLGATAQAQDIPDILVNHDGLYNGVLDTEGPAGGTFTYRAKVKLNAGDSVSDITLTEILPAGSIYKSHSVSGPGISCTTLPPVGVALVGTNNKAVCTINSLAAADGFKWVNFNVVLPRSEADWDAFASAALPAPVGEVDGDGGDNNKNLPRRFTTNIASDLGITIAANTAVPNIVANGESYSYTINVTNHGPDVIPPGGSAKVTFEVPAGAPVTGPATGTGWTCLPPASGVITCTYPGQIVSGAVLPPITVPVDATASGPIGAAASVEGYKPGGAPQADGQLGNNTASVIVTASGDDWADMSLSKSVTDAAGKPLTLLDAAAASTEVIYTLTPKFEKGGLTPANVTVTDTLPTGVTFASFESLNAGWNCTASAGSPNLSCTWGGPYNGAPGSTMEPIVFKANVAQISSGSVTNTGKVSLPGQNEPNTTNNEASATLTSNNTAQLSLTKTAPQRPARKGEPFNYTLVVTNDGPMPIAANAVTPPISLTDTPTAPLKLKAGPVTGSSAGWSCGAFGGAGAPVTCTNGSALPVGGSLTLVLEAEVDAAAAIGEYTVVTNRAETGPVPGRGGATVSTSAKATVSETFGDLEISKTIVSPTSPPAATPKSGDEVTYRITVVNKADSTQTAKAIRITDALKDLVIPADGRAAPGAPSAYPNGGFISATAGTLPSGTTSVDCGIPTGTVDSRNRTLTCDIDQLEPGKSVSVDVKIRPHIVTAAPGATTPMDYTNTASAFSPYINDPTPEDNTKSATLKMTTLTDLTVVKQVSPQPADGVAAGQPATYTVTVQNLGPSSAQSVKMEDFLPSNAIMVGEPSVPSGGVCRHIDGGSTVSTTLNGKQGGKMECTWTAALAAQGQYVVKYLARSVGGDPAPGAKMDNRVVVSTETEETIPVANNSAQVSIGLKPAELDLQVQMLHSDDGLLLGQETEYTLIVRNALESSSYATLVKLIDQFPTSIIDKITGATLNSSATFSYVGGSLTVVGTPTTKQIPLDPSTPGSPTMPAASGVGSVNATMCVQPAAGATTGPLNCTFPLMAPGDAITIKFKLKAESLPPGAKTGTIFHSATVKGAETEFMKNYDATLNNDTTDRTSTSNAATRSAVDWGVQKLGPAGMPKAGDTVMYAITVSNYGTDSTSPTGTMTDTLPTGLLFVSAKRDGASVACTVAVNVVTCPVPQLARGARTVFSLETKVDVAFNGPYPLVNKAKVAVNGDNNPGNDEDEVKTGVPPQLPTGIPTLSQWSLILLSLLLAAFALRQGAARRRM